MRGLLHPQPRLMAACPAHHAGHCHGDNHSLYLARQTARYAPPAACLLPVASRRDFCVYAAGFADEEDIDKINRICKINTLRFLWNQ